MASKKRSTPLDDPPSADDDDQTEDEQEIITNKESSTEEEEEEDDDVEDEEESQEEPKIQIPLETPKIQTPKSKPAESGSSEEEEEEEEESGSESEEETPTQLKTSVETPKKTLTLTPKSSSVFDFDTDHDFKSPATSGFAIKPSKKIINVHGTPEKTPTSKRLFSGSDLKDRKKIKVSNGDDDEKKSVIKRVWTDDDEILLLKGFMDYQSKKGCSPLSDMDGFYQFTMDFLPGNASKSQLYEKFRRLKKKFRVNSEKVSENGEDPVFPKPHERKLFEISKKIWGIDGCETVGGSNSNSNVKSKTKTKTKPKVEVKEEMEIEDDKKVAKIQDFATLYPYLNIGLRSKVTPSLSFPSGVVHLMKENLSLIGEAKAKELDEKWKALLDNETMLRTMRLTLIGNVLNLGK